MRIGVDIMGGDYAPEAIVKGAILARKDLSSDIELVLFGDENIAKAIIKREGANEKDFVFVHTTEVIEMGEHPAKSFAKKTDSSIAVAFRMLSEGKIDGIGSAGNTGAMLVGTMMTIKSLPGIIRPTIASLFPQMNGKNAVVLDVGINADVKPELLYQYGIIGSVYSRIVSGIANPKVGLLNIGSEEEKGNLSAQAAYQLMKGTKDFNFIGNVEGNDIFIDEKVDVIVCDGFTGNIVLKLAESFYHIMKKKFGTDEYVERFNHENFGGVPVLGVNKTVVIAHGVANDVTIRNMIFLTKSMIESDIQKKFKEVFNV